MAICDLCANNPLSTADEQQMQACKACAKTIGIIPMPPARRPPAPCQRCNGRQFMRVIPREHSSLRLGEGNGQISAPMFVTHAPTTYRGWISSGVNVIAPEEKGVGLLETYICRACGFVEWYCCDVERIAAHPHLMSELIDYESETPYR